MAAPAEDGLARIVRRLALVFALAVGIGLPGGYFGLQYSNHLEQLEVKAQLKAESLSALVAGNPVLWAYQLQRLEELLQRRPPQLGGDRAIIRDAAGEPLVTVGIPPRAPVLVHSSPIYDSGRVVGQVEITHSYREVVSGTLVVGLLGLLLGVLVYTTLLVLPLRALRRITAVLVHEKAALSASAARYRAVAETTNDAIITADSAGTIVGWNPAAERTFGYTEVEAVGQPVTLVVPHRYRDRHVNGIQRIQAGGERRVLGKSVEMHGLTKAGREFPLEIVLSEWETREGRFFAGIIRDITGRKQAELALARQKDLYDMLSQTNQAIVRIANREELFSVVCRVAVEHGRFRFAWIGLLDKADPRLKPVARYGNDAGYIDQLNLSGDGASASKQGLTGETLLSGTYVISNDFLNDPATVPWHAAARRAGVSASAKFPIRQGGAVIGAISFYAGDPGFFTDDLVTTIDEMAKDVSFALENYARDDARKQAVQAILEGEERYRQLFASNPHPMWVFDQETLDFLAVNDAAMAHYGWSREEFLAMTLADIRPEEDIPALLGHLATDQEKEFHKVDSSRHRKKDGTLIDVEISSHAIDFGGRRARLAAAIDITKRKAMEETLKDNAAFRELLLQAMPLPVFHKDASGRYTGCNRAFAEFIGKSMNDIVGKTVYEVSPQEFAQNYRDKDFELLDDPAGMQVYESRVIHADGTAHDVIFHKARIADSAGKPTGIVGAITDITENKRAQEELRAAEEQFHGLVEQSIAGIYIIQDGTFAYANPRLAQIRGFSAADEIIGRDPLQLIAEKDRGIVADTNRRLLAGEMPSVDHSFTALCKDGSGVEVGVHSALATYRGRPAIIGMMQDISEKKRAEEQIKHYISQLEIAFMQTVEVATTLSEMRDPYTAGHERRVAAIAVAISAELGFDARRQEGLRVAGYLHDVGKIIIPAEILAKPTKLTPIEYQLIKGHAQASYDVLKNVEFPWPVAKIALQHHERTDGSGYPQGLKGEAILLEARIMAVADTVEAMSSHRPYRPGLGISAALSEIERGRGSVYDVDVADACLRLFREKGYTIPI